MAISYDPIGVRRWGPFPTGAESFTMNIQFCDLCNESVAEKELQAGRAYERGGRLICAACDQAMGGGGFVEPAQKVAKAQASVASTGSLWAFAGVSSVAVLVAGWALWHARAMDAKAESLTQRMNVLTGQVDERWARLDHQQGERWKTWSENAALGLDLQGELWSEKLGQLQREVEDASERVSASQDRLRADWRAWQLAQQEAPKEETPWVEPIEALRQRIEEQRLANEEVWVVLADRLQNFEDSLSAPQPEVGGEENTPWFSLTKNLTNSNPGLRLEALFSLEQTRDRRICSYLNPLLTDPDPLVRVACARVLKDHRYRPAVPLLIEGLEDPVLAVREGFIDALQTITKRQFGYRPDGREADRRRPLKDWQDWWKKMGDTFLAGDAG
ncbi:MAG: HEAT repeat domain-containing protein [Planctomycetes bacterium]|nr:HEAT repeat domain-containing protein [Planctomycetota bacterium]